MRRLFLWLLALALTAQAPLGEATFDAATLPTHDDLVRYARYRRKVLRGQASWSDKKNAQALKAAGLTAERAHTIGQIDGYYTARFFVRQAEQRALLLRQAIVECRAKEGPCARADEPQWRLLVADLNGAEAERAEFAKRHGMQLVALLDRHEETYLELVALALGVPWKRSPDLEAIRLEARRPLD